MKRIAHCTDCRTEIDVAYDPFCMVTPHGERYDPRSFIPMCKKCRIKDGYDIEASYDVVGDSSNVSQPQLPRICHQQQPRPESDICVLDEVVEDNFNPQVETN